MLEYPHPSMGGAAVNGGYVIRDGALPSLLGRYIYADTNAGLGGELHTVQLSPGSSSGDSGLGVSATGVVSFGEDACAHIYVATLGGTVPATIIGTNGSDVRSGTPGRDVIVGLGGNDKLSGLAGNDLICGGPGRDTLKGGKGRDQLDGQGGKDILKGGPGKDVSRSSSAPAHSAFPSPRRGRGGRPGRPPPADSAEGIAYFFFALHFWTDVALLLEPSEKLSVATSVHFFFLHRAIT